MQTSTLIASPSYVQIEPVGQCNLRCTMCPIQFRQDGPPYGRPAFMEFETYQRLIDQFTNLKELHLQGLGEPMMHPRYYDMVRYAARQRHPGNDEFEHDIIEQKASRRMCYLRLDTLHVSIDGATAQTYERIRLKAHFDRVLHNLDLLLETRERLGTGRPHLKMVMVIMKQNLHELPDLVRLGKQYQMEEIFVQHLSHDFGEESLPKNYKPMREYVQEQTLYNEEIPRINHYFEAARSVAKELNIPIRLPHTRQRIHPAGTPGPDRCSWPWTGAYISYQGYAMPCCMVATPDRSNFGNMAVEGVDHGLE